MLKHVKTCVICIYHTVKSITAAESNHLVRKIGNQSRLLRGSLFVNTELVLCVLQFHLRFLQQTPFNNNYFYTKSSRPTDLKELWQRLKIFHSLEHLFSNSLDLARTVFAHTTRISFNFFDG